MAAKIPIAPTMNLNDAEELIRQTKVAATSGDLFFTDWQVGQSEKYYRPTSIRSKSEPRNILADLYDQNILSEQKRELIKKNLKLQRQKFKDNQARKSRRDNEFEQPTYQFPLIDQDTTALLNE